MNSPLILFSMVFPQEILDKIQQYIINDHVYDAIRNYIDYVYDKQWFYEDFVLKNYVIPNCNCYYAPGNGNRKLFKNRDCSECFVFDSTIHYMIDEFKLCIVDNEQKNKIY